MKARKRNVVVIGFLLLAGCAARLPRPLHNEIRSENEKLQSAERQLDRAEKTTRDNLASAPDLFNGTSVAADWPSRLRADRQKIESAKSQDRELERIARQDRAESERRAEWLLSGERNMRETAVRDAEAVASESQKWLSFKRNLPSSLDAMKREHDAVRAVDFTTAAKAVSKAEQDWPAKKDALETRLADLRATPDNLEKQWKQTDKARQDAAAGKATGPEIATLIQTDEALSQAATGLPKKANDLQAQAGQLYNSWDKILTDLDKSREGPDAVYREKVKTVTTHYDNATSQPSGTTDDEKWVTVPEPTFLSVQNDLGMSIGHKDAGQFDSDAQTVPQPPGFAYMATPEQGRNQYGYWSNEGGHSVWTWLPAYFIMRDLLWGHDYRPIVIDDYRGYRSYRDMGRTWYGQTTPEAPPRYGSHGTFTEKHYASSRYVQSGGFRGSGYASHPGAPTMTRSEPRFGSTPSEPGVGKRFGSPSSGRRFGAAPSSPGRRFGSPGRSFGRRR